MLFVQPYELCWVESRKKQSQVNRSVSLNVEDTTTNKSNATLLHELNVMSFVMSFYLSGKGLCDEVKGRAYVVVP